MAKKGWLWVSLLLLLPVWAVAEGETYSIKLLAVQENHNGMMGSEADLFLELKEGSGRVFLDTYPVTKMDTQISTRFAKEIACSHFKLDCDQYDFFYTIRAESNIIGGPSAGAAVAVLTAIAVLDLGYDSSMTVTGTVNSGGLIGPVGGVKEKLEAASKSGLKKVLVPVSLSVQPSLTGEGNETNGLDLVKYGKENLSLEVQEVMDLDEVMFQLTGMRFNHKDIQLSENEQYKQIMQKLQRDLCGRTDKIYRELAEMRIVLDNETEKEASEARKNAENASLRGENYASASFCFGNNIRLKTYFYQKEKPNWIALERLFRTLETKTASVEKKLLEQKIETISDLQTYSIVKERLNDAKEEAKAYREHTPEQPLEDFYPILAYGEERQFSAASWMDFFAMEGKKFDFNQENLQKSCFQKMSEAEEQHQYVSLFVFPGFLESLQEKIDTARRAQESNESALCLITASQAKAEANAILGSLGVNNESLAKVLTGKKQAVERVIAENTAEGKFPILGYSYYQYALSLKEKEPAMALVYLEYALEMSDLGIYFPEEKEFLERIWRFKLKEELAYFGVGVVAGALGTLLVVRLVKGRKKVKRGIKKKVS